MKICREGIILNLHACRASGLPQTLSKQSNLILFSETHGLIGEISCSRSNGRQDPAQVEHQGTWLADWKLG
ncbi:unnamed protein product [Calypogeia fissa]